MPLNTPVAFIIFNRPDTTAQVFAAIRNAQPKKLFVIADGPRKPEEAEKCEKTRAVIDGVDWECEVFLNYSDTNMGCGLRPSSGISWVFEHVEEAIILEDDCLPHPDFFLFCQTVLEQYRHDTRVMHIGGTNVLPNANLEESFLFCRLTSIWGWATWRRAWQHYDYQMKAWPECRKNRKLRYYSAQENKVAKVFDDEWKEQKGDVWDAQWWFTCFVNQGLGILPKTNLVSNIGFRPDATHTPEPNHMSSIPVQGLQFPLRKPLNQLPDPKFDEAFLDFCWGKESNTLASRLKSKIRVRSRLREIIQAAQKSLTS